MTDARSRRIGERLVAWYDETSRDLPWRRRSDAYSIWVSEIMLQQTTVAAVTPRYTAFLELFPDVSALAAAPEDEVLGAVAGLGYYRRFRAMKKAAETLVEEHGGRFPSDPRDLRRLPGIGEYTAGAIASIAFGVAAPAVDGNVIRVVSRLERSSDPATTAAGKRRIGEHVLAMMPEGAASRFNQALFDLGAGPCSPSSPDCDACPVRSDCLGHAAGDPETYPAPVARRAHVDVSVAVALLEQAGRVLIVRRPDDASRMPGFWELPEVWGDDDQSARAGLLEWIRSHLGLEAREAESVSRARHGITHHRLACELRRYEIIGGDLRSPRTAWVTSPLESPGGAVSTISKKLWSAASRT